MLGKKLGWGTLVICAVIGVVSVAEAGDMTIVAGSACVETPVVSTPAKWRLSGLRQAPSQPVNISTAAYVDVQCPITRDHNKPATGLLSLRVRGYVPIASQTLGCSVWLFSDTGVRLASLWKESSTSGFVTLNFGALYSSLATADSFITLTCRVPPEGSILSIRYEEPTPPVCPSDPDECDP